MAERLISLREVLILPEYLNPKQAGSFISFTPKALTARHWITLDGHFARVLDRRYTL